jgi:hypothetical protein
MAGSQAQPDVHGHRRGGAHRASRRRTRLGRIGESLLLDRSQERLRRFLGDTDSAVRRSGVVRSVHRFRNRPVQQLAAAERGLASGDGSTAASSGGRLRSARAESVSSDCRPNGIVKANECSRFSALNSAERGGNSRAKTVELQPALVREQAV